MAVRESTRLASVQRSRRDGANATQAEFEEREGAEEDARAAELQTTKKALVKELGEVDLQIVQCEDEGQETDVLETKKSELEEAIVKVDTELRQMRERADRRAKLAEFNKGELEREKAAKAKKASVSASRTVPSFDATRIMLWVVSFSISGPFLTEMLRAGCRRSCEPTRRPRSWIGCVGNNRRRRKSAKRTRSRPRSSARSRRRSRRLLVSFRVEMNFNVTWSPRRRRGDAASPRWRRHDHMRVDASRRYPSTQASRRWV